MKNELKLFDSNLAGFYNVLCYVWIKVVIDIEGSKNQVSKKRIEIDEKLI